MHLPSQACSLRRLHVIMRLALQLELAAHRCALRECPLGAVGTRGVSKIDPARSKPQHHVAPAKPHRALRGRERHAACLLRQPGGARPTHLPCLAGFMSS